MKHLYLLRHAKSSWKDPTLDDHDRPLAPRGRRAAKVMARYLRERRIDPALVLCSSAVRAVETLERVLPKADRTSIRIEPDLYGASDDAMLERLRQVSEDSASVLMIGHNPGLQDLALALAGTGPDLSRLEERFPTGALATLGVDSGWRELSAGSAELVDYVVPKSLSDEA